MTTSIHGGTAYTTESAPSREIDVAGETAARSHEVSVTAPHGDTVTLSVSREIEGLVHQGESVSQIANTLGLTTSLVNSYLFVPLPVDEVRVLAVTA